MKNRIKYGGSWMEKKKVGAVSHRESSLYYTYVRWVVMTLIKSFMHVLLKLASHWDVLHLGLFL